MMLTKTLEGVTLVIGITGGKSVVTKLLHNKFNAAIIDTDTIGHEVIEPGSPAFSEVVDTFGTDILMADGTIDRQKLGSIVFGNDKLLLKLNSIIHPAVEKEVDKRIAEYKKKKYNYIALETALLIKVGYNTKCDKIWYVYSDTDTRLERLYKNRGLGKEKALRIFESQNTDEEFRKIADGIIDNSGSETETELQIKNILESYGGGHNAGIT